MEWMTTLGTRTALVRFCVFVTPRPRPPPETRGCFGIFGVADARADIFIRRPNRGNLKRNPIPPIVPYTR